MSTLQTLTRYEYNKELAQEWTKLIIQPSSFHFPEILSEIGPQDPSSKNQEDGFDGANPLPILAEFSKGGGLSSGQQQKINPDILLSSQESTRPPSLSMSVHPHRHLILKFMTRPCPSIHIDI